MTDNEEEFKKKIKEALNKEDKQKSIEVFFIISILIFATSPKFYKKLLKKIKLLG